jgi:hypothetical protein
VAGPIRVRAHVSDGHFVRASSRARIGLRSGTYRYETSVVAQGAMPKYRSLYRVGGGRFTSATVFGEGKRKAVMFTHGRAGGLPQTQRTFQRISPASIIRFRRVSSDFAVIARRQGSWLGR